MTTVLPHSELTQLLTTLASAVSRNPNSVRSRLIRVQLKAKYGMNDAQIDEELNNIHG